MRQELEQAIAGVCKELFSVAVAVELTRPDEQFGDYATNVALQLSKKLDKDPKEIAETLAKHVPGSTPHILETSVAGPGFINFRLTDEALLQLAGQQPARILEGKSIVAEYSDPNPFKVLHAGHLYTSIVGDAIAKLLETAGGNVHRVNFGGDVGLHVGRTMYVVVQRLGGENPEKLAAIPVDKRSAWMADCYIEGTALYEDNEQAKAEIVDLNKQVYRLHAANDHETPFAQIYWTCRQWSYDYFNEFYARIGSHFEKYYPESEVAELGVQTVREHIPAVFVESEGAIVFKGDGHGLHTRVFINSEGLPTYEAKDIGLIMAKKREYNFDKSVVITGNEQAQYMAVVLKAIEQFAPELAHATTHLTHGIVKLAGGVKMSSRKGNILQAVDVIDVARAASQAVTGKHDEATALAAIRYAFLKNRMGGDIIYDPVESVALEGNSGPYLQYAHARARSVLVKSQIPSTNSQTNPHNQVTNFQTDERSLLRKIGEYTEVVDKAVQELMPHHIATYLYELAQNFNSFYEHNRVLEDPRQDLRLRLVKSYADTLKKGLGLLNIPAPDRM
jgi:arginyl-tRNA synthetase